jgi:hypothetical protein
MADGFPPDAGTRIHYVLTHWRDLDGLVNFRNDEDKEKGSDPADEGNNF